MSVSHEPVPDALAFATSAIARVEDALVVMPAPRIEPERFLATGTDPLFWHAPDAEPIAALGAAIRVRASGSERFTLVRDAIRLDAIEVVGSQAISPRLFGAFEFEAGGRASFVLPRWLRGDSWLALQVTRADGDAERARLLAEIPAKLAGAPFEARVIAGSLAVENGFRDRVRRALSSIDAGDLAKVVLSEGAEIACDASPLAILARLRETPGWRFLFSLEGASFLGVSPERLVRRTGRRIEVDALAGSRKSEDDDALAGSRKDRLEQRIVIDEIAHALAPLCADVVIPAEPKPKRFAHVTHLHTAVSGELARDSHVLDVAAALHPTPAVGGAPREPALAAIRALEGAPRGWWAGAAGWFDAAGDGELVVAIRSLLLENGTAKLRAGAGIVRGSEPDAERAEIALKRRSLLHALGVDA